METQREENALLVQLVCGKRDRDEAADSLRELERLADTAGARVVGRITQRRSRPTPALFVGEGKLADIQLACRRAGADLVIFDNDLSAVQVPILLIVGDHDPVVLELNRCTQRELLCENRLAVVARATQLCAEPGALERVAELACDWFLTHLTPAVIGGHSDTGKDSARS